MVNKPRPLFDTLEHIQAPYKLCQTIDPKQIISSWIKQCFFGSSFNLPSYAIKNYHSLLNFLYSYRGSMDTFNAYRRDLERLIQWCWLIQEKSVLQLKRAQFSSGADNSTKSFTFMVVEQSYFKVIL